MSRRGDEYLRIRLMEIDEASRGLPRLRTRSAALRRLEGVPNLFAFPVQVTLPGGDPTQTQAPQPLKTSQQSFGRFVVVNGYSAAPGSLAALADGTGRKGDTRVGMSGGGVAASRGRGTLALLSPMAGASVGAALCSGTAVLIVPMAGKATGVAKGLGTEGPVVNQLGPCVGVARGRGTLGVRCALAGACVAPAVGAGSLSMMAVNAGKAIGAAIGTGTLGVRVPLAGAATSVALGAGTMQGAGTVLKFSGKAVGVGLPRGRMQNTLAA